MVKIKIINTVKEFMPYFQMVEYEKQYKYYCSEYFKSLFDWNRDKVFIKHNAKFFEIEMNKLHQIIYN